MQVAATLSPPSQPQEPRRRGRSAALPVLPAMRANMRSPVHERENAELARSVRLDLQAVGMTHVTGPISMV